MTTRIFYRRDEPARARWRAKPNLWTLFVVGFAAVAFPAWVWAGERIERGDLWVEYERKQQGLAERVASEAEGIRQKVVEDLGLAAVRQRPAGSSSGRIGIRLYSSSAGFRRAVGAEKGQIVVGIAHSHGDFIEMDASGLLESPREILAHEITHILLQQDLGPNSASLPLWLNEGLAQMESAPMAIDAKEHLRQVASQGRLFSLASLEEAFPEGTEATSLAYLQSQGAADYLRERCGIEAIRRLLGMLRDGKGFEQAFAEATGMGFPQFEKEWEEMLRRRPLWEVLFRGGAPLGIWAAAALLVLYGFLRLRRRWRRKMREWEEEER